MNRTRFSFGRFSLTPALSRWERENRRPIAWYSGQQSWFMDGEQVGKNRGLSKNRLERGIYAASASHRYRTLKRPEGRAPSIRVPKAFGTATRKETQARTDQSEPSPFTEARWNRVFQP